MGRSIYGLVACLALLACKTTESAKDAAKPQSKGDGKAAATVQAQEIDASQAEATAARAAVQAAPEPPTTFAVDGPLAFDAGVAPSPGTALSVEQGVERAVVKIELFKGKRSMSFGTGFFISKEGLLLTNYHVFSDVLEREHKPVFYLDSTKERRIESFEVIRCMDHRDMDLCLLKLPHTPASFLEVTGRLPKVGDKVFTIGNPKGDDFSHKSGKITHLYSDIRKAIKINDYTRNRRVALIQVSADLRKGFSGGPIVDTEGNLLGVTSVIMHPPKKGDPELVLAISSEELKKYIAKTSLFDLATFTEKQRKNNPILMTPVDKLSETQIKKACRTMQKDECLGGIKASCADSERTAECKRLRAYFKAMLTKKK